MDEYRINGTITFSAEETTVKCSDELATASNNSRTFTPNFTNRNAGNNIYALNVNNDYVSYNGIQREGSIFVLNLRTIHPFEAYMETSGNNAKTFFPVFDNVATAIEGVTELTGNDRELRVYNINGQLVMRGSRKDLERLPAGIYIVNGKKVTVK